MGKKWFLNVFFLGYTYGQKKTFSHRSKNNEIFLEILIYYGSMDKNDFFKMISKNMLYPEMLKFTEICTNNDFFKMISINVVFVEILIFLDIRYFKVISNKRNFLWNIDIFGNMVKKLFFQQDLNKVHFPQILIFTQIWTKNANDPKRNVPLFEMLAKNNF